MSRTASADTLAVTLALGYAHPLLAGAISHALPDVFIRLDRQRRRGKQEHCKRYGDNDHFHLGFSLFLFL